MKFRQFIDEYLGNPAPREFNFARDVVDARAIEEGQRVAMVWLSDMGEERRLTFGFFKDQSDKAANVLLRLGIGRGDVVLLMLGKRPEWWVCALALMKIGAVPLPVSTHLKGSDIAYRCREAGARAIITEEALAGVVESRREEIGPCLFLNYDAALPGWVDFEAACALEDRKFCGYAGTLTSDPMIMYFTSGTSGYPKMVTHDYLYALAHLATAELWHGEDEDSLQWTVTDTGWAKLCWGSFIAQWMVGSTIFVYEYSSHFDGRDILRLISHYGITNFCAPPTVYRLLIREDFSGYNLSRLRVATCAGEAMEALDMKVWEEKSGLPLHEGYGQTEAVLLLANLPGACLKIGSLGRPLPGQPVEIVDDCGKVLPPGTEGNIAVRIDGVWPPGLFHGYAVRGGAETSCFHDGHYFTNDLGVMDEEGYFWFRGRRDDVFKSAGFRISPFEVERAVLDHEAVEDCLVVSEPDRMRGLIVKALVKLKEGVCAGEDLRKDIRSHARKRLASYLCPRKIEFVSEFPRTLNGKKRHDCRP